MHKYMDAHIHTYVGRTWGVVVWYVVNIYMVFLHYVEWDPTLTKTAIHTYICIQFLKVCYCAADRIMINLLKSYSHTYMYMHMYTTQNTHTYILIRSCQQVKRSTFLLYNVWIFCSRFFENSSPWLSGE